MRCKQEAGFNRPRDRERERDLDDRLRMQDSSKIQTIIAAFDEYQMTAGQAFCERLSKRHLIQFAAKSRRIAR